MERIDLDTYETTGPRLTPSARDREEVNLWQAAHSAAWMLGPLTYLLIPPVVVGAMAVLSAPGDLWKSHPMLTAEFGSTAATISVPGILVEGAVAETHAAPQTRASEGSSTLLLPSVGLPTIEPPLIETPPLPALNESLAGAANATSRANGQLSPATPSAQPQPGAPGAPQLTVE